MDDMNESIWLVKSDSVVVGCVPVLPGYVLQLTQPEDLSHGVEVPRAAAMMLVGCGVREEMLNAILDGSLSPCVLSMLDEFSPKGESAQDLFYEDYVSGMTLKVLDAQWDGRLDFEDPIVIRSTVGKGKLILGWSEVVRAEKSARGAWVMPNGAVTQIPISAGKARNLAI
ncbi:MAG TPA: hypothetical protein EYM57_03370 [Gammaproteobacteria bacterium]|nr:hypothetical protein [Gammaproteobacteria bacterium]